MKLSLSQRTVRVTTPSRLHFGLLAFGGDGPQFGGVGAMVDRPGVVVEFVSSSALDCRGPLSDRAKDFALNWADYHGAAIPGCRIEVVSAPPQHVGLGVGTQLGLAIAAGLNALLLQRQPPAEQLARSVGRGRRSAIGTYGFDLGGLIVEFGKTGDVAVSPLASRHAIPAAWRFVLIRPLSSSGLAGAEEQRAFTQLPAVPPEVTRELRGEIERRMLPALEGGDPEQFGESIYRYGYRAGSCFANCQGGAYNGPLLARLVEVTRSLGVNGVGQSSWGPTLFALLPDLAAATSFCERLRDRASDVNLALEIAAPCNAGATCQGAESGNLGASHQ